MINAFHSNWSKPFFIKNEGIEYYIDDFEILTTILSALKWREYNGSIKMITDEVGAEYYKRLNIEKIWDLGIDVSLNNIDKNIDPYIFWAAGKIFSMKTMDMPMAMIDTDFIIWSSIQDELKNEEVAIIHREELEPNVYPDKEFFQFNNGYYINNNLNWQVKPCNTAFLYISNNEFKDYYVRSSFEFMENVKINEDDRIKYMVFAEQRLISMCCQHKKVHIKELSNLQKLNSSNQKLFTHTWGFKDVMRNNYNYRKTFCTRCLRRIIKEYPYMEDILRKIKAFNKYFNNEILIIK